MSESMFVPVNFKWVGRGLLLMGFALVFLNGLGYLFSFSVGGPAPFIIGMMLVAVGLYLTKAVNEKK